MYAMPSSEAPTLLQIILLGSYELSSIDINRCLNYTFRNHGIIKTCRAHPYQIQNKIPSSASKGRHNCHYPPFLYPFSTLIYHPSTSLNSLKKPLASPHSWHQNRWKISTHRRIIGLKPIKPILPKTCRTSDVHGSTPLATCSMDCKSRSLDTTCPARREFSWPPEKKRRRSGKAFFCEEISMKQMGEQIFGRYQLFFCLESWE